MDNERAFFDAIAGQWDNTRAVDSGKIAGLIKITDLKPGFHVLDAGSGTGVLLPFIKDAVGSSGKITAVDFSANMLAKAKKKYAKLGGITFTVADIMEYVPGNGGFDAILCFNFFPHIRDKQQFMTRMRNYLKEDGCLVIMHDMSRQQVNGIHQGSDIVKEDTLASGIEVREWLITAGYQVPQIVDTDDRYYIKAVKSN